MDSLNKGPPLLYGDSLDIMDACMSGHGVDGVDATPPVIVEQSCRMISLEA